MSALNPEIAITSNVNWCPPIALAPIDEQEMATLWPIDPDARTFLPVADQAVLATASGAYELLRTDSESLLWGVYMPGQTNRKLVGLSRLIDATSVTPEVGVVLLGKRSERARHVGRGVLMGMSAYALEKCEAEALCAQTLRVNTFCRGALKATGYVEVAPPLVPMIHYGDGRQTSMVTNFTLFGEGFCLPGGGGATLDLDKMTESRANYAAARAAVEIIYS